MNKYTCTHLNDVSLDQAVEVSITYCHPWEPFTHSGGLGEEIGWTTGDTGACVTGLPVMPTLNKTHTKCASPPSGRVCCYMLSFGFCGDSIYTQPGVYLEKLSRGGKSWGLKSLGGITSLALAPHAVFTSSKGGEILASGTFIRYGKF